MASNQLSQDHPLIQKAQIHDETRKQRSSGRRFPSVYDVVAGRVSAAGFIPDRLAVSTARDTTSSSTVAIPPEAVLFRTKDAPTRYTEADIYFSDERKGITNLPQSDLLKALHCYTADFYSRATDDRGIGDWKSLDETALIALGILLEEASLETLGESGDLVFTEGETIVEPIAIVPDQYNSEYRPKKRRNLGQSHSTTSRWK